MLTLENFESYSNDAAIRAAWASSRANLISFTNSSDYTGVNNFNIRIVISAASITVSGNAITVKFKGHKSNAETIIGASIGERSGSTGNFASAPTRLTFSGSNGGTIPAGGYLTSDQVTFAIDETKDYLVHFYLASANVRYGAASTRYYKLGSGVDNTLTEDISGLSYSNDATVACLDSIDIIFMPSVFLETSIVSEGTKSIKVVAAQTSSLNKTLTRTLNPTFNLSGQTSFKFNVRSNRIGSNFKIGLHDSGGTTTEVTPNITGADVFQEVTLDLSAVADADKNTIDSIIYTQLNADAETTVYLDYLTADNVTWPDAKYVYHGIDRGDGTTGTLHASTISEAAGAGSNLSAGILKDGEVVDDVTGTYAGGGTDFPDPANVLEGDTTNGVPGTYHEAATAEVKNGITFGPSSGYTGTYSPGGTYTEGQAAQLATDQAAVNAGKASIKDDTTILTITGTYDFTAAIAAAAAAQLVTDQVAVLAKASYIIDSQTILSQAGLYHEATPGEVAYGITFGPSSSYTGTFGQSAVGNEEDIIKNLFIALKARLTAITNDLNTDIADRLYKDVAPQGAQFPYVVASLVTDVPDKTFTEDYSDVYVQFSLFSNDAGSTTELENMYAHLKELYDECELSVTGAYWVWMKRQNATRIDDDTTTENGNSHVFGYAVDYWVRLSKH